jgi:hypothetical protein
VVISGVFQERRPGSILQSEVKACYCQKKICTYLKNKTNPSPTKIYINKNMTKGEKNKQIKAKLHNHLLEFGSVANRSLRVLIL